MYASLLAPEERSHIRMPIILRLLWLGANRAVVWRSWLIRVSLTPYLSAVLVDLASHSYVVQRKGLHNPSPLLLDNRSTPNFLGVREQAKLSLLLGTLSC